MLIGVDASRANQEQKTGVEWYSYYLIQELKKIPLNPGDKFILYSRDKLKGDLAHLPNNWQSKVLSWPFKYIWTQIRLSWEMLINPPDVLFVPAHALPLFCRAKTVITIHDLGFKRFKQAYPFWQRIYACFVHWWANKKADQIIVPSNFTKKELRKLYQIKEEKIVIIPEGYDKNIFNLNKHQEKIDQIFKKYKIKKPYFLFIGRLEKKKNIENLLKAYSQVLDSRIKTSMPQLVLIGQPGFGYQEIQTQIKNLNSYVCQIGYVQINELIHFYHGAEVFIFPSLYEGFGLPVLEAMACGCPVIASKAGSIPEVGGQAALYFSSEDIVDMVKIIKKIIGNKGLKIELRKKGLEQVKNFSWEKCAQETMTVLLNI